MTLFGIVLWLEGRGRGLKVPSYLRFDGQVRFVRRNLATMVWNAAIKSFVSDFLVYVGFAKMMLMSCFVFL